MVTWDDLYGESKACKMHNDAGAGVLVLLWHIVSPLRGCRRMLVISRLPKLEWVNSPQITFFILRTISSLEAGDR